MKKAWYVYILRCGDGSLYTGITTDVVTRLKKHNAGKGAAYTRSHLPVKLVRKEKSASESAARKREAEIKGWTRVQKLHFLKNLHMHNSATTVKAYLDSLPADRKAAITAVRKIIVKNLPKGMEETMGFGMINYVVPLKIVPKTYNGQPMMYAALASQKNYMSVYLMGIYGHKETEVWFKKEYKASGKKLDAGKSCIRFKKLDDLPLDLIGKTIGRISMKKYIEYSQSR